MSSEEQVVVSINRQPSFTEIWHEGSVTYENKRTHVLVNQSKRT